jgi:hypothetical protein
MANAFAGFGNLADRAVFSGGSFQATLPITNLNLRQLGLVARTTDLAYASTVIEFDLTSLEQIRAVALVNHNLSFDAQYRLTIAETSDLLNPTHVSDVEYVWPGVYRTEDLDFEAENWWSGQYLLREIAATRPLLPIVLASAIWGRFGKLELFDSGNSAGFVQAGRPFIGGGWQPVRNMLGGAGIGFSTSTTSEEAASGALFFDRKTSRREVQFTIDSMTDDEAMAGPFEMMRQMGIDGEVLFCWDPADLKHALRRTFLGHLRELSPIQYPWHNRGVVPVAIQELI